MKTLILIISFVVTTFAQQLLTAPTDLPSGSPFLVFSKIICDFDQDGADDVFTLWRVNSSGNPEDYISIYSTKKASYLKSLKVQDNQNYNLENLSCGNDGANCFILFYDYIITRSTILSKKKV